MYYTFGASLTSCDGNHTTLIAAWLTVRLTRRCLAGRAGCPDASDPEDPLWLGEQDQDDLSGVLSNVEVKMEVDGDGRFSWSPGGAPVQGTSSYTPGRRHSLGYGVDGDLDGGEEAARASAPMHAWPKRVRRQEEAREVFPPSSHAWPYACHICGSGFLKKEDRAHHLLIHESLRRT